VSDAAEPAGTSGVEVLVEGVSKSFGARVPVLHEVSLDVRPGEFVSITGPSGSGKSTLLALIGGLDRPDAGEIRVGGIALSTLRDPVQYRREVVAFVFQHDLLLDALSAQANVETPLLATGVGRAERQRRARELLEEVGIGARADHRPSELSGGERERVALARALANHPRLLLADEPTGALDTVSAERALDLLAHTRAERAMTLIVVSHDPAVAARADRVVQLIDGRVERDADQARASSSRGTSRVERQLG
jgi:putative ABC transport system ATP-binding protein